MIIKIEVDGFKSLSDFKLELKPGLNILVGPNGAGKTNIVLFFEFISNIVDCELSEAFSKVGGAGSILKKVGENEYQNNIKGRIIGEKTINIVTKKPSSREKPQEKRISYSYDFNIELSPEKVIYFSNQRLKITDNKDKIILDIEQITTPELKTELELHTFDEKMSGLRHTLHRQGKDFDIKKMITGSLQIWNLFSNSIFNTFLRTLEPEYIYEIMADLKGGETFNIIPSEVKKSEDVAKAPGIQKNGSGLAATLYAMKRREWRGYRYISRNFFPRYYHGYEGPEEDVLGEKTFNKIIENVRLANDSITDIDVDNDPFSNNLNVKISIKGKNEKEAILPLSQMSDGTIKWMTLITAIFTSRNIFSIEEPENFLHPWMQSEIIKIMRNNISKMSFILMTTHSESLLNSAIPKEIIIVSMNDGKTNAKRVKNIRAIKKEISNTGFGPGHFYITGDLQGG